MWEPGTEETAAAPGCEPVVDEAQRRRMLWLMTEYFRTLGVTDIKARLPGFVPPPVLAGTLEDHRPDLTCRQSNAQKTPVLLEVVTPQSLEDPGLENRWSLLSSAAKPYSAELHFVVPRWTEKGALEQALCRRLARMELPASGGWTV